MYFSSSQKKYFIFLPSSWLFAYLDLCVLKKEIKFKNFISNYLPPDPGHLVWEGSGTNKSSNRRLKLCVCVCVWMDGCREREIN